MKINGLEMELDVAMHVNGRCDVCERQVANRQVQFMRTTGTTTKRTATNGGPLLTTRWQADEQQTGRT